MVEAFPLCWPENWKRTPAYNRAPSRFRNTTDSARKLLRHEVELLGGSRMIISTNIPLRNDGEFYASARNPEDPGVAVYFLYGKRQMCFACDAHLRVWENLNAIAKTINALRGIERWGASDMLERAFRGFAALPESNWRRVLEVGPGATRAEIDSNFRRLAMVHHPDKGGDPAMMAELNKAREAALKEVGQ